MSEQHHSSGGTKLPATSSEALSIPPSTAATGQSLVAFLELHPDIGAESRDDAKCKALLGAFGMLDLFTRSNEPNLSTLTFPEHATHWIVGLLWSGYPKAEQNGYQVFCLPKQHVPEQGVRDFVQHVMDTYGGYGQEDGIIELPRNWRKHN